MYSFICASCGKISYSASPLKYLYDSTCPYCGKDTLKEVGEEQQDQDNNEDHSAN